MTFSDPVPTGIVPSYAERDMEVLHAVNRAPRVVNYVHSSASVAVQGPAVVISGEIRTYYNRYSTTPINCHKTSTTMFYQTNYKQG